LVARGIRRRRQKRSQLLVDVAQGAIVQKQRFVDLGQTLQDCGIRGDFLPQLDKRADDVNAHGDCAVAPQDVGDL
jgi:hypothetical protein